MNLKLLHVIFGLKITTFWLFYIDFLNGSLHYFSFLQHNYPRSINTFNDFFRSNLGTVP